MSKSPSLFQEEQVNGLEQRGVRRANDLDEHSQDLVQSADGRTAQDKDSLLQTFVGWKHEDFMPKEQLAEKGYRYEGPEDTITCTGCGISLANFQLGDDPDDYHAQQKPSCHLLKSRRGDRFVKSCIQKKMQTEQEDIHKGFLEIDMMVKGNTEQLNKIKEEKEETEVKRKCKDEEIRRLREEAEAIIKRKDEEIKRLREEAEAIIKRKEEEIRSLRKDLEAVRPSQFEQLKREQQYLSGRLKDLMRSSRRKISDLVNKKSKLEKENYILKIDNIAYQRTCQDLGEKNENLLGVVKLQAKKIKQMNSISVAQLACIESGYPLEQVQAASKTYRQANVETAEKLMKILLEMEKNCQESQPSDSGQLAITAQNNSNGDQHGENYFQRNRPSFPKYSEYSARQESFSAWSKTSPQSPKRLAQAGFFFLGYGDCTRCFFCGISLRQWLVNDEPWFEHARWSPECHFVKCNKGQEFIDDVQRGCQQLEQQEENQVNPADFEEQGNHADNVIQNGNELEQASVTDESEFEFGDKVEENNDGQL